METLTIIGVISLETIDSEDPAPGEEGTKQVITLDGYRQEELTFSAENRPELYRVELYNSFFSDYLFIEEGNGFFIYEHDFFSHFFEIKLQRCQKNKSDAGVFCYFLNITEGYGYYKVTSFNLASFNSWHQCYNYFNKIFNIVSQRAINVQYKTKIKHNIYLKSKKISLTVEPVGQGSLARLTDAEGNARVLFDVGHGTPVNKEAVQSATYKFNSDFAKVQAIFLSHWDEDHFKLAAHHKFKSLPDSYWFFPFSLPILLNQDFRMARRYEPRILVWEMLLRITRNYQFMIFDHGRRGTISLGVSQQIKYSCGSLGDNFNDRGVVYTLIQKNKKSDFRVLIPGDADYRAGDMSMSWDVIIGSHHGSRHADYTALPKAKACGSKIIFSFGFHSTYKHPAFDVIAFSRSQNYAVQGTSFIGWRMWDLKDAEKLQTYNDFAKSLQAF